jgi:hypothetical protein
VISIIPQTFESQIPSAITMIYIGEVFRLRELKLDVTPVYGGLMSLSSKKLGMF